MIDQCIIKENPTFFISTFFRGTIVNLDGFQTFDYDSKSYSIL